MRGPQGVADRLRSAAFAEIQAREAFAWAAERFADAPEPLRSAWRGLSAAEDRHLGWLLTRLSEVGSSPNARPVSPRLWRSLTCCGSAREFSFFMASAEERGRLAGLLFQSSMAGADPLTAEIFGRIAEEEAAHVALVRRFF